jgi:kynurenine 3-monooxygenase
MMDIAEKHGKATIHYNEECTNVDLKKGVVYLKNSETEKKSQAKADLIFAADGAFSAVRYNAMQTSTRFNFSQKFIADGYREILLPADANGDSQLDKNSLHIWPRGRFMLIGLANEDGSFTCTLFMPFEGEKNAFDNLDSKDKVNDFFQSTFPDFYKMMPNIADAWGDHPLSSLAIMRCEPWAIGKTALMGDAAHATVPFYGQGMNSGFEDCTVLSDLMKKHNENWDLIFDEYNKTRKKDGDAVQDLSIHNYYVMRDHVADPKFLLQKKIEANFSKNHPEKWIPLYSQVSFSNIPYSEALQMGKKQDDIMKKVMAIFPNIDDMWDSKEVEEKILGLI